MLDYHVNEKAFQEILGRLFCVDFIKDLLTINQRIL